MTNDEYDNMVYQLPSHPSPLDYALLYPRAIASFFRRVHRAFGWQYVCFVVLVYGLNQGLGESFGFFGTQYLLTDEAPAGLGLGPERFAAIEGFAHMPWQMKAVYGILSDLLPIGGLHRSPYVTIASIVGSAAFGLLATLRGKALFAQLAAVLLMLGNFSMASPDVMIDASMAERTVTNPRHGSDLQALAWGMLSIFSLVGSAVKGSVLSAFGTRTLFAACVVSSAAMLPPALLGWMGERRDTEAAKCCCAPTTVAKVREAFADRGRAPVLRLSLVVCALSFALGGTSIATNSAAVICAVAVTVVALVTAFVYIEERKVSSVLAKASVYIFLSGALQPSTPAMFYWYKETESNCSPAGEAEWRVGANQDAHTGLSSLWHALFGDAHNADSRPCFEPEFVGLMSVVGYASFAVGTAAYNRYFSAWSYRRIWQFTQIIFVVLNLSDYVWVSRWNLALGIPDRVFVMGEEVLSPMFARLAAMPMFILAARLCPEGIEATLFALTMGLSNFGSKMGSYVGIGLLSALGGVDAPHFTNLRLLVVVRSLTRALPIALIPFLVPVGSPNDPTPPTDPNDASEHAAASDSPISPSKPVGEMRA